jgi:hypothetical protein
VSDFAVCAVSGVELASGVALTLASPGEGEADAVCSIVEFF